jgi:hypothetical protein
MKIPKDEMIPNPEGKIPMPKMELQSRLVPPSWVTHLTREFGADVAARLQLSDEKFEIEMENWAVQDYDYDRDPLEDEYYDLWEQTDPWFDW